jgi:lipoprotein signal peptidase
LVTGLTGLLLGCTLGEARAYGCLLVASHLAPLAFGLLYANQETALIFFSFNAADNVLHVGVILVGLVIALLPARQAEAGHRTAA